jgi:hypothetical protein
LLAAEEIDDSFGAVVVLFSSTTPSPMESTNE